MYALVPSIRRSTVVLVAALATGLALTPSRRAEAQIWKRVRDEVAGQVASRVAGQSSRAESTMVQSTAALTGAAIDSSLAAGRLVVSGLQLEDAGHPSADAERLIRQLATALRENRSARFRLVAAVDPSGDALADQAISDAYSHLVWAMLVGAGASPDRLIPGGNSPALNAAGQPEKEGGAASMAKAAAEELLPGAKLVKLGIHALANRHAEPTHADSLGLRRLARLELVRVD